MDKVQATAVAKALRGETWNSGGDIWLVIFRRRDSKVVVLSDEVAKVYENEAAFGDDQPSGEFLLH